MGIEKFAFPTTIHFGAGARKLVAEHLAKQGIKRPLVVTDRGIAALPLLPQFVGELKGLDVAVYSGISGNPVRKQVMDGAEACQVAPCRRSRGPGRRRGARRREGDRAHGEPPGRRPRIRVGPPASARDGPGDPALHRAADHRRHRLEVGRSSVISDDETHVKKIIFSPLLLAKAVFADPELTVDLPSLITAATGMDALTHNVESYLSPAYHPLCDGIALEGVRIAARALPIAVADGHDIAARSDMLMASMMGAIAFQKDLGAVHSCAHALSTVTDMHHGLANGIMIDHVMRFNLPAATDKLAELAHVARARGGDEGSSESACARLHRLARCAQGVDRRSRQAVRLLRTARPCSAATSRASSKLPRRTSATRRTLASARPRTSRSSSHPPCDPMKITNPATGAVLVDVVPDNAKSVRAKYERARRAQPKWAATPLRKRLAAIRRFRELVVERMADLARTLSLEVGKPIRQSRNELNGLTGRIDFFLEETERALREQKVFDDGPSKTQERIAHDPLGVIANISAWNYPLLRRRQCLRARACRRVTPSLYKPSEFATLTGTHIADMLHAAGVPEDVFVLVIGDGKTGTALLRQPVDGVFFTGSFATGAKIAASTGRR
jgi:alcohol dehydrogenase class IV